MKLAQIISFRFTPNSNGICKIWGEIHDLETQDSVKFNSEITGRELIESIKNDDQEAINFAVNEVLENQYEFI